MTPITDSHTHNPDAFGAIISVEPEAFDPKPGRIYSVGIHPWNSLDAPDERLDLLAALAAHPQVVAVGETGLDALRGAPLDQQIALFKRHIAIAQRVGKPVVAHMVRTAQPLVKAWREMRPSVPLIVHGMRGNANVARTLIDAGCYLSYGEHLNPEALLATPPDKILAETDDSPTPITDVIAKLARTLALTPDALARQLTLNNAIF